MPRSVSEALPLGDGDKDGQGIEAVLHIVAKPETEKRVFVQFNCQRQGAFSA
ncbi:MAG: hypothetical protein WA184_15905 [Stellaceae bacterium]